MRDEAAILQVLFAVLKIADCSIELLQCSVK